MKEKQKYKHSKLDLIWIIPEMLGGLGVMISSIVVVTKVVHSLDIWELIFFLSLVIIVFEKGLDFFAEGIKDIIEVFIK